jgi:hypothetical protein
MKTTRIEQKTCQNCGHTGADVVTTVEHIGGHGDAPVTQCWNQVDCWQRINQNGGYESMTFKLNPDTKMEPEFIDTLLDDMGVSREEDKSYEAVRNFCLKEIETYRDEDGISAGALNVKAWAFIEGFEACTNMVYSTMCV